MYTSWKIVYQQYEWNCELIIEGNYVFKKIYWYIRANVYILQDSVSAKWVILHGLLCSVWPRGTWGSDKCSANTGRVPAFILCCVAWEQPWYAEHAIVIDNVIINRDKLYRHKGLGGEKHE